MPSVRRWCDAIRSWDSNKKVVVIGTGGLSHQLDGERAGFINKDFDPQVHGQHDQRPGVGDAIRSMNWWKDRYAGRGAVDVARSAAGAGHAEEDHTTITS